MKHAIYILLLALPMWAWAGGGAEKIQSDCKGSELAILRNKAVLGQISADAKVANLDCTVVKNGAHKPRLVVLYVLNAVNGVESDLAVFARDTLSIGSKPLFKSESLGFDSFPILVRRKHRLIFTLPPASGNTVFLYTNTQTAPNSTQFKKWELSFSKKSFSEVPAAAYPMDSTKRPKILEESGKSRAILNGKMVDL